MTPSPDEMAASMVANLEEKTGRNLDEWLAITRASGLDKHGTLVKFLKAEHGMTHGYASLVAHKTLSSDAGSSSGDDLLTAQYAGAKAGLRPIYDTLVARIREFGPDVELAPKNAYVSLRRNKQFGLIHPSTRTRVDVGINLGDRAPGDRLEASGSFNTMVSHRVRLSDPGEVDDELVGWLREAYEQS